jgi:hypothetical protein
MKVLVTVLIVIGIGGSARAVPIFYTESVTGSGTLGSSTFTNALVTMTFSGVTANVVNPSSGIFQNQVGTGTFSVAGLGSGTFTDQIGAVVNQSSPGGGLSDFTTDRLMLWTLDAAFTTYNLTTSFGPISDTAEINPVGTVFATSLGNLGFTSVSGNSTFTASTSAVPEPAGAVLVSAGLLGLAILRRKHC